jgi:hypothetical protein
MKLREELQDSLPLAFGITYAPELISLLKQLVISVTRRLKK